MTISPLAKPRQERQSVPHGRACGSSQPFVARRRQSWIRDRDQAPTGATPGCLI